ncbi:hypothetical protein KIL84_012491 [Mauremys mutica]|uniref:Uncharacterized protein n=1 Tax=Mauremys mutica TaxID=74926 RepID=A0A9D3XSN4_9SAUR|nr:hypothetical protein KIL84_012491 [Mauremys mutica]
MRVAWLGSALAALQAGWDGGRRAGGRALGTSSPALPGVAVAGVGRGLIAGVEAAQGQASPPPPSAPPCGPSWLWGLQLEEMAGSPSEPAPCERILLHNPPLPLTAGQERRGGCGCSGGRGWKDGAWALRCISLAAGGCATPPGVEPAVSQ